MEITQAEWTRFKNMLSAIDKRAVSDMNEWLESRGGIANVSFQEMSSYGYALATKYGEASASLSAQMYDEVAKASGMTLPAAEVANTVSYSEIAKAIVKVAAQTQNAQNVSNVVGRYTKRAGADTMLKNAERDGAQFAWVPAGDSCAFCIALASRGWQFISKKAFRNGHAEHIHSNCDCTYAVRFDKKTNVQGYDPQVYKDMYYGAEGNTPQQRINYLRRTQYQNNSDEINLKKRIAYAKRENSLEMYRKTKNTGDFKQYSELMTKKHVRGVAAEMGLDPKDVRYKIDRNVEMIGTGYFGHTSDDGKTITLYPDAFKDREQLVKTIGHENVHLQQVRANGKVNTIEELLKREEEATNSEDGWWQKYVKENKYRSKH